MERALSFSSQGEKAPLSVSGEHTVIGRSGDADAQIEDPSISRRHAELTQTQTGWTLVDLGSSRGTYLNNLRGKMREISDNFPLRIRMQLLEVDLQEVHAGDSEGATRTPPHGRHCKDHSIGLPL